jgi:Undecaprenyl-phosphate glucose phosphotransferase
MGVRFSNRVDRSEPGATPRKRRALAEEVVALPARRGISPVVFTGCVGAAEALLLAVIGLAAWITYLAVDMPEPISLALMFALPLLSVMLLHQLGLYRLAALRSPMSVVTRLCLAWAGAMLAGTSVIFFLKLGSELSRVWIGIWFLAGLTGLVVWRLLVSMLIAKLLRQGRLEQLTAIIGGGAPAERLIRALEKAHDSGYRICGLFDDRSDERSPDLVAGYPKVGAIDDLVGYVRRVNIDLVLIALPATAELRVLDVINKLAVLPVDVRIVALDARLKLRPRTYTYIAGVPVLPLLDRPIADWNVLLKWLFDKVVGASILLLVAPVMLAVALAVKRDSPGPVLFKQRRYGFNNELIEVFKFRSMHVDQADANAARLVTKDDSRVTRVGRFIRRTSLDELPQLFNVVFKGNLSLVGPRPHALHAKAVDQLYGDVVAGYFARHKVKPGITGWAQINGWRGETDTTEKIEKRVEHDIFYIDNWSVFFDLYILFKTPFALANSENAY